MAGTGITDDDLRSLAEFRHQIRRFLAFSERAARDAGIEPRQHQLLLAVSAMPAGERPTIRALSERLQLRHHSIVELVDRLEARGLVRRERDRLDRRQVLVVVTEPGERLLRTLSASHRDELARTAPALLDALAAIVGREHASDERAIPAQPGERTDPA